MEVTWDGNDDGNVDDNNDGNDEGVVWASLITVSRTVRRSVARQTPLPVPQLAWMWYFSGNTMATSLGTVYSRY